RCFAGAKTGHLEMSFSVDMRFSVPGHLANAVKKINNLSSQSLIVESEIYLFHFIIIGILHDLKNA
ncbi:MAG: hypothetical protein AAF939_22795, partial [Planctomycetota bacterium]